MIFFLFSFCLQIDEILLGKTENFDELMAVVAEARYVEDAKEKIWRICFIRSCLGSCFIFIFVIRILVNALNQSVNFIFMRIVGFLRDCGPDEFGNQDYLKSDLLISIFSLYFGKHIWFDAFVWNMHQSWKIIVQLIFSLWTVWDKQFLKKGWQTATSTGLEANVLHQL